MKSDGIGKGFALDIAALTDKIVDLVAVTDSRYSLGDNRTGIEFRRYVMRSRANEFHAPLMGTVVRLRARECRQE